MFATILSITTFEIKLSAFPQQQQQTPQMDQIISNKREIYHKQIRKDKKLQQQTSKRKKIIDLFFQKHQSPSQDIPSRNSALKTIANGLNEQPSDKWQSNLSQLKKIVTEFNQFELWAELNLINKLLVTFKPDFHSLNLTSKSSFILSFMIHSLEQRPQQLGLLVDCLVQKGLVQNLLNRIGQQKFHDVIEQLYLVGNILSESMKIRNRFISGGWMKKIIKYCQSIVVNAQHLQLLSWLAFETIKHYEGPSQPLKYQQGILFIQIFANFLMRRDSFLLIKYDAIRGLLHLSKRGQIQIKNIYHYPSLLKSIISFVEQQQKSSSEVWELLCQMSSTKFQVITNQMIKKGILNVIEDALNSNPSTECEKLLNSIIYNIVLNGASDCDNVLRSNLLGYVVRECNSVMQQRRMSGLRILSSLIQNLNNSQCEYLLEHYNVIESVAQNLISSQSFEIKYICIRIFKCLVVKYAIIFHADGNNKMAQKLQKDYNLQFIITNIIYEDKNPKVSTAAQELLCILSQNI